jgi:hypothetical protein
MAKLVYDAVSSPVYITNINWMVASGLIVVKAFNLANVVRRGVFMSIRWVIN